MIELKIVTIDKEIPEKDIDHITNRYRGDFEKTSTDDGWRYRIIFEDEYTSELFRAAVTKKYPKLKIEQF